MTPAQRRTRLRTLAASLKRLAAEVTATTADPLNALRTLHEATAKLEDVRKQIADLKGGCAEAAKDTMTHEQIAEALGVSKPYVQQMVYRGRALDAAS